MLLWQAGNEFCPIIYPGLQSGSTLFLSVFEVLRAFTLDLIKKKRKKKKEGADGGGGDGRGWRGGEN